MENIAQRTKVNVKAVGIMHNYIILLTVQSHDRIEWVMMSKISPQLFRANARTNAQ